MFQQAKEVPTKRIMFMFIIFLFPSQLFADSVGNFIKNNLISWNIKSVRHYGKTIQIISTDNQITDTIYTTMVSGICMGYLSNPDPISEVSEIQILNKWGKQGYVFEGGERECKEHNNLPIKETKIFIFSKTHVY